MALMSTLKNEIKEAGAILRRIRLLPPTGALGANFRKFGPSFGAYDFSAFLNLARRFYAEGLKSKDPLYTIVEIERGRTAIDYNGEIRGVFSSKGRPLAFFRPDFRRQGYVSKAEEIKAFRTKTSELFTL